MVIISCLPIPAAEAQQTRLEFQILFSSPWYPAHGSPKVLKDFWGSDFEGQVHKQFQLSQLADVFCFEALVPQGANPESASPPTDSRRSGHFREGMERIPQKHTHTEEKVTSGQASGRCCTQGHDCTLSSLGGSSSTTAQKQLYLLRIFGQDLLSWRPRLTPALNTNMTCTQTTEKCFLVTASFNSQVPNKSLNCKVSKQRPFPMLTLWINVPMNILNPVLFPWQQLRQNPASLPGDGRGPSESLKDEGDEPGWYT